MKLFNEALLGGSWRSVLRFINKRKFVSCAVFMAFMPAGVAQGFINLNFESASIPNSTAPGSAIPINNGLPGWTGYFSIGPATNQAAQVTYDGISLGGAVISIVDTNVGFGFNP